MRIATWNVNSLMARMSRVEEWVEYADPDILCMQETKVSDAAFPHMAFSTLGYETASHGDGRWNGVAIASKVGIEDVRCGFADGADEQGCRLLSATCGGMRMHSVYAPNGRSVGSEHYTAKLKWLDDLRNHVEQTCRPSDEVALCGDFNVAPDDRDVWDPRACHGSTHVTEPERDALRALEKWGLVDSFRMLYPQPELFTWWDYRAGNFHKHLGMRIDLVLLSRSLADKSSYALIDRNARKGKQPSDHAPLFVDVEL
jgi:exodeoxyribonuclease-3